MRYASDESDTDDAMSPASKRQVRKAKGKAGASSDEEEAPPSDAAPRCKARMRGRAKEAVEEAAEEVDDSGKEETEPSDVDMSDCDSEDDAPRKPARGKKSARAATKVKKKAKQASLPENALSPQTHCIFRADWTGQVVGDAGQLAAEEAGKIATAAKDCPAVRPRRQLKAWPGRTEACD